MFNLLAIDAGGGGTPPLHTTSDAQPNDSITSLIFLIVILFGIIACLIFALIKQIDRTKSLQQNASTINPSNLTKEEQNLLNDFRSLPVQERPQACTYVRYLAAQNKNTEKENVK